MSDLDFVRSLARYLCGDPHMADDIAQEALVAALERKPQNVRNWRGWLSTVTRNLLFNKRRDEQRLKTHEEAAARLDTVPSAAEVAESEQVRRDVVAAVMALPDDYRAVVLLRHYRGKSTKECAEQLGMPESTVRTRLQRAIEQLRGKLDADHGGDRKKWLAALAPFALPIEPLPIQVTGSSSATTASAAPKPAVIATALVVVTGAAIFIVDGLNAPAPLPEANESHNAVTATATGAAAAVTSQATDVPTTPTANAGRTSPTRGGHTLAGIVTIAQSDDPVPDARVTVTTNPWYHPDRDLRLTGKTDASGRYEIALDPIRKWSPLAQEQLRVEIDIRADGFISRRLEARLRRANSYMPEETIIIMDERIEDPVPVLETSLRPGEIVRGRVVTSAGIPVAAARVGHANSKRTALTDPDGTFEVEYDGQAGPLIASHLQHGIAAPLSIDKAADVGDIALIHHMQAVRGQTVYPDGRPAPNQSLVLDKAPFQTAPVTFQGVEITRFHHRFCMNRGARRLSDANGNFAFVTLTPGNFTINSNPMWLGSSYKLSGTNHTFVVPAAGDAPFLRIECPEGLVHVRATDSNGLAVQPQQCAYYTWPAERAQEIEQRILADGVTLELLQSAGERKNIEMHRNGITARPNTLIVAEACSIGTIPTYGYCRLGPDDYGATIDITLATDLPTGAVQIPEVDRWTLVRACRMPLKGAVGIELPHLETEGYTIGVVQTAWHLVPSNGVITKLPAGKLTLEVWRRGGPREPFLFPSAKDTTLYSVEVKAGQIVEVTGPGTKLPESLSERPRIPKHVLEKARQRLKERRNG